MYSSFYNNGYPQCVADVPGTRQPYNTSQYPGNYQPPQIPPQFSYQPMGLYHQQPAPPNQYNMFPLHMQQQNPQQPQLPQREKNTITIQDPKTMENVTAEALAAGTAASSSTPPRSEDSSARETPPSSNISLTTPEGNDLAAEFAARVARAASGAEDNVTKEPLLTKPELPDRLRTERGGLVSIQPSEDSSRVEENFVHDSNASEEEKESSSCLESNQSPALVETEMYPTSEHKPIVITKNEFEDKICNTQEEIDSVDHCSEQICDSKVEEPELRQDLSIAKNENIDPVSALVGTSDVPDNSLSQLSTECQQTTDSSFMSVEEIPQENGPLESFQEGAKPSQKKGKNKRKKELNRLGEEKEGGDLDAFVDSETPKPLTSQDDVSTAPSSTASTQALTSEVTNQDDQPEPTHLPVEEPSGEDDITEDVSDPEAAAVAEREEAIARFKEEYHVPIPGEGDKKSYNRESLMKLQTHPMSRKRPENLPNINIVKDLANETRMPSTKSRSFGPITNNSMQQQDCFMPGFVRSAATPKGQIPYKGGRGSQQGRRQAPKVVQLTSSVTSEVKLHVAENAWKPALNKNDKAAVDAEQAKSDELVKRVRGILNKLTPQKFDTLVDQVKSLPIDSEERLAHVIDLVFEKAIDEPNFSEAYANMCRVLALMKVPQAEDANSFVSFRKLLLTKCQREFEKNPMEDVKRERLKEIQECDNEEKKKLLQEELENEIRKLRRRSVGNIRFIGEVFKTKMLTLKIMHECIRKLLEEGDEESLECLCRLMSTIGKELECGEYAKKKEDLQPYFDKMADVVKARKVSSRTRFMLQDVIDLRNNGWKPRRDENAPKTIDQIQQDAKREQIEKTLALNSAPPPPRDRERDKKKSRETRSVPQADGWTVAGKNKFDSGKLKNTLTAITNKTHEPENMQLGPGGKGFGGMWTRGSSLGSNNREGGRSSGENEADKPGGNRFQLLAADSNMTNNYDNRRGPPSRSEAPTRDQRGLSRTMPSTSTSSNERQKLLATVKNITSNARGGGSSRPGSQERERGLRDAAPSSAQSSSDYRLEGKPDLSDDEIMKLTSPLIDEFLNNSDFNEACTCVTEKFHPTTVSKFVLEGINHVLEKSSQFRCLLGRLHADLILKRVITREQYLSGMSETLQFAQDLVIDIPKLWDYLGEIIAPVIEESVPLSQIIEIAEPVIKDSLGESLFGPLLEIATKNVGPERMIQVWQRSSTKAVQFLTPKVPLELFVKKYPLLRWLVSGSSADSSISPTVLPNSRNQPSFMACIDKAIRDPNTPNDVILQLIKDQGDASDPKLIRALTTWICESAIVDESGSGKLTISGDIFKKRSCLLITLLEQQPLSMELQVLYAVQALVNKLQHPSKLLLGFFQKLYDFEVIQEDAFYEWEVSDDPCEQEGKGVAVKSVNPFLLWLRTAADDEATAADEA